MTISPTGATTVGSPMIATVSPSTEQDLDSRHPTYCYDFGLLPIPKRLRYDPDKPIHFGMFLMVFFSACNALVCANLYYCQPILIQLSKSFSVTYDEVSRIPTLVQAGYGIGLLTISPMGDMLRRRGLILVLVFSSTCLSIGLAATKNLHVFEVLSFLIGFTSVTPQVIFPLTADLAPPERRAFALSLVTSGFLTGILIARVLSGVVANFVSWRYVYWMSVCIQGLVLTGSYLVLPDYPVKDRGLSYLGMFHSMGKFMVTEPLVVQIVFIAIASVACFTNFWVTLTFLLGGPPYYYSTILIGLFGLLGVLSMVIVPLMGQIIDRVSPWYITLGTALSFTIFQAIQMTAGGIHVSAVVIACFGIDVSRQIQHVALATLIFAISDTARSRLNSLFLLAVLLGQVMGTSVGTRVFVSYGWRTNALLALAWSIWHLFILLLRGPHCPRQRWIGWHSGSSAKAEGDSAALSGQAPGCASDTEKAADVTQSSAPVCSDTSKVDKKI